MRLNRRTNTTIMTRMSMATLSEHLSMTNLPIAIQSSSINMTSHSHVMKQLSIWNMSEKEIIWLKLAACSILLRMLSGKDKDSYIYMDLHIYKLEKWADRNLMNFNKGKTNPASGQEPHASIYAGDCPAIKQLCRKIPGVPGGHKGGHEPAVCPCSTPQMP